MGRMRFRIVRSPAAPSAEEWTLVELHADGQQSVLAVGFVSREEARVAQRALEQLCVAEAAARVVGPANDP